MVLTNDWKEPPLAVILAHNDARTLLPVWRDRFKRELCIPVRVAFFSILDPTTWPLELKPQGERRGLEDLPGSLVTHLFFQTAKGATKEFYSRLTLERYLE
jgi:hypothetical protein